MSRFKTEYLYANFSEVDTEDNVVVCIIDDMVPLTNSFQYLGSIMQDNRDIIADVRNHIKADWRRRRSAT